MGRHGRRERESKEGEKEGGQNELRLTLLNAASNTGHETVFRIAGSNAGGMVAS